MAIRQLPDCGREPRVRCAQKLLGQGGGLSSHHGDRARKPWVTVWRDSPVAFAAFMYDYNGGEPRHDSRHMNSLPRTRISTFRRQAEHGLFIDPADVVLLGKGSEVLKFRRKSDSGVQHGDSSLPPRMS
jgi:hypothetical protein